MSLDSGFNLGNAYGRIVISDNVDEAVNRAQASWTAGIQNIGRTMQNLGANLTLALAPVSAFVAQGVGAFASFDAILSEIEARTGATAEQMEAVRVRALEMGRDTAFSATDAADAMLQLLSSGYDLTETMTALEPVLNLAAAGGLNLGTAADAVTDILAQFRLGAESATQVTDALSAAAGSSSATVSDMVQGFANVGPVASSFGISVDQTAAILATFSENGIKGAEAGTQLRSMLNNMTRPTEDVQGMWQQLGVSMVDAQGNFRDINDIIQDLNVAMAGMSESERADAIRTLAGSYGQMGLTALLAADGIEDMEAAMAGAASAAEVAAARNASFRGTMNQLRSSIEGFSINVLGPALEAYVVPFVQRITELLNRLNDWMILNPQVAQSVGAFLLVLSALGPTILAIGTAITFLFGPLNLLIVGIAAVGTAWATNFLGIRDLVLPIIDRLWFSLTLAQRAFGTYADVVAEGGTRIEGVIATISGAIGNFLVGLGLIQDPQQFLVVRDAIEGFLNGIASTVQRVYNAVAPLVTELIELFSRIFANVDLGQIAEVGMTLLSLTNPIGIATTALRVFGVDVMGVFETVVGGVTDFIGAMNDGGTAFDGLRAVFGNTAFIDDLETRFNGMVAFVQETVIPGLQALADWFITDGLPAVVDFVNGTVVPAVQGFFDFLGSVWAKVSPSLGMIADWFLTTALPQIQALINESVLPLFQDLFNFLATAWEIISPGLASMADWFLTSALPLRLDLVDSFIPLIKTVVDILGTIWDVVSPALLLLLDFFVKVGFPIIQSAVEGALEGITAFIDYLVASWERAQPHVQALADGIGGILNGLRTNVIDPVVTAIGAIIGAAQTAVAEVERILGPVLDEINRVVSDPLGAIGGDANPFREGSGVLRGVGDVLGIGRNRDSGGPGMANLPYLIGTPQQGREVFVPRDDGTFLPNFADTVAQMVQAASGGGGGGDIYVTLAPPAGMSASEATMLGEHIGGGIRRKMRERGADLG